MFVETNFITMFQSITLVAVMSLAIPLSAATISGINELKLTFNPTQDLTIVATDNEVTDAQFPILSGPSADGSLTAAADASDDPAFTLLSKNLFQASAGPGSTVGVTTLAKAEGITLRNSGRVDANVLINFVLTMNGTAEGPGTAQFFTRNLVETRSGSNDWTTFFDASINVNSTGPLTSVDFCTTPNVCSGQFSLIVPADSVLRVRSIATSEGIVSQPEVPEPSAFFLAGAGLSALLLRRLNPGSPR